MACGTKVDNFDLWGLESGRVRRRTSQYRHTTAKLWNDDVRFQKDVLRFEIAVNQPRFFENRQSVQELRREHFDKLCAKTLELILLDELVQVGRQQLEHETQVILVNERIS